MCDLDVFAGNFALIDWDIHALWLSGRSVAEAAAIFIRDHRALLNEHHVSQDIIVSDIHDNYRLFGMFETALLSSSQDSITPLQLVDLATKKRLKETYYSLDASFCREILGKKLNTRLRKDLDEVAEKTNVLLRSCRRQFDNIKRIFKAVEETPPKLYVVAIVSQFGFSRSLAEKYAALVFASYFKIELGKKKLAFLTFEDVLVVSLMLINDWGDADESQDPSLDREFLSSLKDMKVLLERDKEHRNVVCSRTKDKLSTAIQTDVEANFKSLTRNIVSLATSLSNNKEVRDFFVHVVEKIVDPMKQLGMCKEDVDIFLKTYGDVVTENVIQVENDIKIVITKFMKTLRLAVLAIYH